MWGTEQKKEDEEEEEKKEDLLLQRTSAGQARARFIGPYGCLGVSCSSLWAQDGVPRSVQATSLRNWNTDSSWWRTSSGSVPPLWRLRPRPASPE
mmetsp:Transcript_102736/g.266096  ORF Transcript_102736/g.266096 Transcript_102736/m.266096 type:complete len:95 (-) Transcript_102736:231-515(-)